MTTTEQLPQAQNFATYDLRHMPPGGIFDLAGGVVLDMARDLRYKGFNEIDVATDTSDPETVDAALRGFIKHIGPDKDLLKNTSKLDELLGSEEAYVRSTHWANQSGILTPLDRSFVDPGLMTPDHVDEAMLSGGKLRVMRRQAKTLLEYVAEPKDGLSSKRAKTVGRTLLVAGNRVLEADEQALLGEDWTGPINPTEYDFMKHTVKDVLKDAGLNVELIGADSEVGKVVMNAAVANSGTIKKGTTLIVGRTPAGVQNAMTFRRAAREVNDEYDESGTQLFVISDHRELALHGEPLNTHQNPKTVVSQIARTAMYLDSERRSV